MSTEGNNHKEKENIVKTFSRSHSFDPDLAEKYSVEEALVIHHFQYWCDHNARLGINFHDGRTWTYQTIEQIAAHFYYFSVDQVKRIISKLTARDILIKGNYNKSKYDRTLWYSFKNEIEFTIVRNRQMVKVESPNGDGEIARPIPKTKTNTKETTTTAPPAPKGEPVGADAPVVVFSCLKEVAISEAEKVLISKTFSEEVVSKAIKWVQHPKTKIKETLIQALKWACKNPERIAIPTDQVLETTIFDANQKLAREAIKKYGEKAKELKIKLYEDVDYIRIGFNNIEFNNLQFEKMLNHYLSDLKLK
jgi:hypothetical protein